MANKLNLKINNDPQIIIKFFGEEELHSENLKLYNALNNSLDMVNIIFNRIAVLTFKNDLVFAIELLDFDGFKLSISDEDIYEFDEHCHTKLSRDRVLYYLLKAANTCQVD